ncbi:MAG: glycosyltransferase [Flavobacteriales bacterium]|nr:glycosyltransferase [Flavobacteriales bacterium]
MRIASCSYLIPRKRVDLWIDVLCRVKVPVEWTHFGDGPERASLETKAASLPSHVRVTWMGGMSNAEIMAWYAANPVHLFALFSELEGGVAVAAQEAASFGIPLLVTDSGGVRDLVNEHTGLLLPTQPDIKEVARWIDAFTASRWGSAEARAGVRAYWQSHFHATTVFDRFSREELGSGRSPSQP